MSEQENNIHRYEVLDGLIVDKTRKCLTTPDAKGIPETLRDLSSVRELYEEWHTYPTGTVIRHECCEAAKLVTLQRKRYRRPNEEMMKKFSLDERFRENSNLFFAVKPSKTAKEGYCVLVRYPDSKQIYLLTEVPRICRPISFAYRETDGINSGYESTTALTTFYKINGFSGWFKKQTFPALSEEYRVEMKMFMYYLFYHYNSRQHLLTLDVADTGTKRTESSMGNHQLETIDSYMPFLYRLYFYLLHADMFNDAELNETIVQKLQYFKENIGDCYGSKGEMLQDKLKVKLGMFRDLIVLMLSDECMFSFPVKATCLKTDGSMQDTEYCLKTMNAYKAFLKYVLIFSETNTLSEEFRRAWCGEGSFQTIENLKMVYSSVYAKRENCTPTQTRVLADGAVMVNGFRFCPDLVSRLYGKLLKTYEECLDGLRAYTGIISVQDCFKRLRGTYCYQKECSFSSCFPEELTRALIENVDSTCFEDVAYKNTLHLFDELCSAIVALVLLSSGSTLRLQEYTKLTQCSPQTLFLHQGRDGEYCYFSTDINKNHSLKRRTMFVNLEVSRYLIHYCCVIKPLLHTIAKQAPLDKTLFSLEEKMKDFQAEQDLIDSVTSTEVMRQISTTQFMRTYIFVSSINKGDEVYISKVVSTRVTKLLTKLGGKGCGAASVRQAFCLYNEEIHKELGFAVTKKLNEMLNQNAGHTELTALRHYAFDSESLQDKRGATFEMCLDATLRLNRMLKMIQEVEAKPEGATDSVSERHSELVFGHQELVEAKQELFPDTVYREHQEAEIHAIGAAAHTYVLQAPTGFGKTILFSTLLKAVNRKDRSLVNLVLVPYSPLLADMTNRLKELGFNVGSASNLSLVWESGAKCDVYIGIYDQLVGSGLHIPRENLGLVVFDEAHCLAGDCSFRDCLKDYYRFNFGGFKKLLFLSATLTKTMVEKTLEMLKITDGMLYSNVILRHPNVGNIYVTSIDPEMAKKSSYDLVQETLGKFLDKFADGKAIVFYCDKSKLRRDSAAFKQCLTINGDMDTAEKRRVINQFVSSKSDRVLMGTKLISNGINVTDVRLVIFAGYDPEAVDFIQGLGRIKKKGLCVVVSSNGFCGADVIGEFYGIYDGEHHWCCGVPDDPELQELFHCVIGDKHRVPVQSGGGDIEFAEVSTPTHEIPSQEVSIRRVRIPEIGTAAAEVATPVLRNDWNPSWIPENSIVIDLDDEDGIGNEGANQTDDPNASSDALSKSMDDTADKLFSNSANISASTDCTGEMADTADSPVTGLSQFALRDLLGGFHIQKGGSAMPKSTKSRTIEKNLLSRVIRQMQGKISWLARRQRKKRCVIC